MEDIAPPCLLHLRLHSCGAKGSLQHYRRSITFLVFYSTVREAVSRDYSVVDDIRTWIETAPRHHTRKNPRADVKSTNKLITWGGTLYSNLHIRFLYWVRSFCHLLVNVD